MFRLNNSKSLALKLNEHFIKKDSKVFLDIQDDMVIKPCIPRQDSGRARCQRVSGGAKRQIR